MLLMHKHSGFKNRFIKQTLLKLGMTPSFCVILIK